MAFKIPQAEKRVSRAPLPGVRQNIRTSPADFGALQAGAARQIGGDIVDVAGAFEKRDIREQKIETERNKAVLEIQERKDKMNAQASVLEFQDAWRTDKDGFLGTFRLDADGSTKKANEWFVKTQDSLLNAATNQRQKELIKSSLSTERTKILNKVSDHEVNQLGIAEQELNESIYTNAVMEAGAPDSNFIDILDSENKVKSSLDIKVKGMDTETSKKIKADGMSAFHEAVINGKIVGDLEFSKRYFEDKRDEILPDEQIKIVEQLKKESGSQSAVNIANEIALTVEDPIEWTEELNKKVKGVPKDQREAVFKQADTLLDAKQKDRAAHSKALKQRDLTAGLDLVLKADNLEDAKLKASTMQDPENVVKGLRVADSVFARKTRDVETNIKTYGTLLDRINKGEFKSISDLGEFYPDLSISHYNHAVSELQRKLNEDRTGKVDKEGDIKYSVAKDAFQVATQEKYDVSDSDQNENFTFAYDHLVESGITDFGEAQKFIKNLFIEGDVRGPLWDEELTRKEAEAEGKLDKWLPNILEKDDDNLAERRSIVNALKSRNILTRDETLMRLYKKDAILKLPLSKAEVAEYKKLLNANQVIPVSR